MSTDNGVVYVMPVPPGYTRDPNQTPDNMSLILVTSIFFGLATLAIIVRLYSRIVIVRKVDIDDYVMVLAWLCAGATAGAALKVAVSGGGKHLWNVRLDELFPTFSLANFLAASFYVTATGLAKSSILLFYLRIFPNQGVHIAVWVALFFTMGFSLACNFANIFSCRPIAGSWALKYAATAKCIDRPVLYLAQAGMSIAADLITVAIPLPVLSSLKLRPVQRVGVGLLLSVGAFVCIVSMIRLKSLKTLLDNVDLTYNTILALMWCMLELNLSIIGGCVPSLKPFIGKFFPGWVNTSGQDSDSRVIYLRSSARRRNHVMRLHESAAGESSNGKAIIGSSARRVEHDPTESEERLGLDRGGPWA